MIVRILQKITIVRSSRPSINNLNESLQWLATSLGLFNLRDKDRSLFRIFIELIKASKKKAAMSSDEISEKLSLSRGTVVHHLNKLKEMGLVVADRNKYYLRVENLESLVNEIERDTKRTFEDMRSVAKSIDLYLRN